MFNLLRGVLAPSFRWKLRRQLQETLDQAWNCHRIQAATLRRLLRLNAGSDFHRDFGLNGIRCIRDFQRALPFAGYQRTAPYIEQMKQGHPEVLLGRRNPLLMFALTSGTTSASKFIPITRQFLTDYRRGWQLWGIRAYDDHPGLHHRQIFQIVSDWDQFRTPSHIPCGNISGMIRKMQNRILRSMYIVPTAASQLRDPFEKRYFALKHGVSSKQIGMVSTANPSTLCQIFRMMHEQAENLIRDLRDGCDSSGTFSNLPPRLAHLKNVSRSRELDRILQTTGTLQPADVWPGLELVSVWTGGSAAAYLPKLREYVEDIPIRDHGLHASEGRMTIPLEDEISHGLLDISSHFFEFVPECEIDSPHPTVLLAHELVEDETYYVLLTTSSGLYRYDIRDVVQCTGYFGTTPLLKFLHKGSHICNLTGEKLTESQVVQAVTCISQKVGKPLSDFTIAPQWGDPPRYLLLVNQEELQPDDFLSDIAKQIDHVLQHANSEYQEKRRTQRLAPLEVTPLPGAVWREFIRSRQMQPGGSTEQYKHPFLMPKLDFLNQFPELSQRVAQQQSAPPSPSIH